MTEYIPDRWVLVKVNQEGDPHYRILAGTQGGYLSGDSWRLNSGIVKVTEEKDYYNFYGHSGSIYKCHKEGYGLTLLTSSIPESYNKKFGKNYIKVFKEIPKNITNFNWIIKPKGE